MVKNYLIVGTILRRHVRCVKFMGADGVSQKELAMIAMQYSFVLPADYDMAIIDRRIAEKGHLLDGYPNLTFKAYLSAEGRGSENGGENLYAPFYVWDNSLGMSAFLCSEGFAGVARSFGWPQVKTWVVWRVHLSDAIAQARFATREVASLAPYAPLAEIRQRAGEAALEDVERGGALAAVVGFEPTVWTRVRFRLWGERPPPPREGAQVYKVGHLSLPTANLRRA